MADSSKACRLLESDSQSGALSRHDFNRVHHAITSHILHRLCAEKAAPAMRLHLTTISFGTILILLILLARMVSAQAPPPVDKFGHRCAVGQGLLDGLCSSAGTGRITVSAAARTQTQVAQSSPPVAAPHTPAATPPSAATPSSQPPAAQGPATQPPAVLTDAEKIRLRTLQVALLRAQSARICGEIKDLASAPEYQAAQQADFEFRSAIDAIYTSRKLAATEYQICDGPGDGRSAVCAGLAKDELALRALPPVAKAKP